MVGLCLRLCNSIMKQTIPILTKMQVTFRLQFQYLNPLHWMREDIKLLWLLTKCQDLLLLNTHWTQHLRKFSQLLCNGAPKCVEVMAGHWLAINTSSKVNGLTSGYNQVLIIEVVHLSVPPAHCLVNCCNYHSCNKQSKSSRQTSGCCYCDHACEWHNPRCCCNWLVNTVA